MINKLIKHFMLVSRHKWKVFKLCLKAGIPIQGIFHDMSKFSPTEFFESVKYYNGTHSPVPEARKAIGYSKAWLHHKGRNKHHYQYWHDEQAENPTPIIPYKYVVEMICDDLSAGMTYKGKEWHQGYQLEYWQKHRAKKSINEKTDRLLVDVFTQVSINGLDNTINKKNLKDLYNKHCL